MNQHIVVFQIDVEGENNENSLRWSIQNENAFIDVITLAQSLGETVWNLRANLQPADVEAVIAAFRSGYDQTGAA